MTNSVTFDLEFRDREHFYRVISWLTKNVGSGKDKWTIEGRVLKFLNKGESVVRKVSVFDKSFEKENALYLALI